MKNKIILIYPKPSEYYYYHGVPTSLLSISSLLVKENLNYNIKIIKSRYDHNLIDEVLSELDDSVIIIGITMMTGYAIKESLEILKQVKSKFPKVPIVVGGPHPTILPEQTIKNKYIDFVIRSQGERTFYELVKAIESGNGFGKISGLGYKENGKIYLNEERLMEDLDNFPELPYNLINIEENLLDGRTFNYISSQGCPYHCGFCSENKIYKGRWKGFSAERVVKDISFIYKKYGIKNFIFMDNNFFVDSNRVEKICRLLIKKKIKISWGQVNGRTENLLRYSDTQWKLIKKAGLKSILVGAESGDEKIMQLIEKGATVQDTVQFAKRCKKYGIKGFYSCIVGFPHPNKDATVKEKTDFFNQEMKSFYNLIEQIFFIDKENNILIFIYTPYPGTPLYPLALKNGFKEPKSLEEWSHYELNMLNTPWISQEQRDLVEQLGLFIIPGISKGFFKEKIKEMKGIKRILFKTINIILMKFATLRWKYKFFKYPIEFNLIKFGIKNKEKYYD